MAKDLRLDVVTSSDEKGLVEAAIGLNELANKADKAGNQMKETAVDGGILAAELDRVKRKQLELAAAFDATGQKSILKQISANQRYESQLKRVGKELDAVGGSVEKEAEKLGKDLGKGAESGFSKWLSGANLKGGFLGFLLTPQGIAGATSAASVLGVMAGGAILSGIGLAGIGGGIALAFRDENVVNGLTHLKQTISNELKDAAQPMVAPLLGAFGQLGSLVKADITPGLKNMFAELAPELGGLTHGFGQFISSVAKGFERAAIASKPLLNVLGSELLPGLGKDLGALFDTIARHSKEAEQGLKLIFIAIEAGIGIVNIGINVFSTLFDYFTTTFEGGVQLADRFVGVMIAVEKALHLPHQDLDAAKHSMDGFLVSVDNFRTGADGMPAAFNTAAGAAALFSAATDDAAHHVKVLTAAWEVLDRRLSSDQAINSALDAIHSITKAIDKHNHTLDQNTVKGRANREALEAQIQTLEQDRDALIKNGMSVQDANKLFNGWVKTLEKGAEKAGIQTSEIKDLNKQLGLLPKTKTINIKVHASGVSHIAGTNISYFASGGHYKAGEPRVVGEDGPEFDIPDHSGTIIPGRSARVSSVMPGVSSSGSGRLVVEFAATGDQLIDGLIAALRPRIRGQFAGNVTAALGGY